MASSDFWSLASRISCYSVNVNHLYPDLLSALSINHSESKSPARRTKMTTTHLIYRSRWMLHGGAAHARPGTPHSKCGVGGFTGNGLAQSHMVAPPQGLHEPLILENTGCTPDLNPSTFGRGGNAMKHTLLLAAILWGTSAQVVAVTLCLDAKYHADGNCKLCPDGTYTTASQCALAPDGRYMPDYGRVSRLAPDGRYIPDTSSMVLCPDGNYYPGRSCRLLPDG